jgi:hypothetical protein
MHLSKQIPSITLQLDKYKSVTIFILYAIVI